MKRNFNTVDPEDKQFFKKHFKQDIKAKKPTMVDLYYEGKVVLRNITYAIANGKINKLCSDARIWNREKFEIISQDVPDKQAVEKL